jgi:hypothetical protein
MVLSARTIGATCAALTLLGAVASTAADERAALPASASGASAIGRWEEDARGLPVYRFTGALPSKAVTRDGQPAKLPEDPWFLLGNPRLTLFVHASGSYQVLTGERAWGRLNLGDSRTSGASGAAVEVAGRRHELVGLAAKAALAAEKRFGVGFARFDYRPTPDLQLTRTLAVRPSLDPRGGASVFVITASLRNDGAQPISLTYEENVRARYEPIRMEGVTLPVRYRTQVVADASRHSLRADVLAQGLVPLAFPSSRAEMSLVEGYPPSLFLKALAGCSPADLGQPADAAGFPRLTVRCTLSLGPQEEKTLAFAVGYSFEPTFEATDALARTVAVDTARPAAEAPFAAEWQRQLPDLSGEADPDLRREMLWNAHALEAMATYREYFDETVIPQGTIYDYDWGGFLSARDHAQHALPLCHTHPALAKSVLRYLMKRMVPDGEVRLTDEGHGWSAHGPMLTSDQQLYFFLLLAEYLRTTGDRSILTEELGYYPLERSARGSGLDRVKQAFLFLRDRVGTGAHGLMRLWNSDWNDAFYFWTTTVPYNDMFASAESHMNTAMAVVILGDLAGELERAAPALPAEVGTLVAAMREHRARLLTAYLADWGSRPFPRRIYVRGSEAYGEDEMWLEPQAFTLLIPELPAARKRALFAEVERRLMRGEALGARQIERPRAHPGWEAGSRENGGFWYALNGPLILGVGSFDPVTAVTMLKRIGYTSYAKRFPSYWAGQWSAADNLESSLIGTEGLPDQTWTYFEGPVYCAHAHAWPLYCYYRLRAGGR